MKRRKNWTGYLAGALVVLLLFAGALFAANGTMAASADTGHNKTIKIFWSDDNEKTTDFRWEVFMRDDGEIYGAPVMTVPIADATSHDDPDFNSPFTLTVTGKPGSTVTKYFTMRSLSGSGETLKTSPNGNEVAVAFTIPLTAPYGITVHVVIE